jgi:FAD binding domain-containing protein
VHRSFTKLIVLTQGYPLDTSSKAHFLPPDAYTRDFGNYLYKRPLKVVRIEHPFDAIRAFKLAQSLGVTVAIRGAGHSCSGQTLREGGLVMALKGNPTLTRLSSNLVRVNAATTWHQLDRLLRQWSLTAPVTPDYLDLTIGGTLSVGGYGVHSVSRGCQLDWVEALTLVTPDGHCHQCSPRKNADLFRYSLGGIGSMGAIIDATIKVLPRASHATIFQLYAHRRSTLLKMVDWLTSQQERLPDIFQAYIMPNHAEVFIGSEHHTATEAERQRYPGHWPRALITKRIATRNFREWLHKRIKRWLLRFSGHYRIWGDYIVAADALPKFINSVQEIIKRDSVDEYIDAIYLLAVYPSANPEKIPIAPSTLKSNILRFGLGLHAMVPKDDIFGAERVHNAIRNCRDECGALQGRPYMYGAHDLTSAERMGFWGSEYTRWEEAQERNGGPVTLSLS